MPRQAEKEPESGARTSPCRPEKPSVDIGGHLLARFQLLPPCDQEMEDDDGDACQQRVRLIVI